MTGKLLIHLVQRGAAESITSLVLQCLLQRGEQHTGSCWQYPVLGCPWSARASLCPESPGTKSQVLDPHRGFKWQYLSHTLLCSLSDSLKRCLCMLFLLPNPFGIQPCWGTSNTTGSCVIFLPWCQGYQRNCCPAHSPLGLYSPKELRSATRASEPGESFLLHTDKALNSFLEQFWELTRTERSEFTSGLCAVDLSEWTS